MFILAARENKSLFHFFKRIQKRIDKKGYAGYIEKQEKTKCLLHRIVYLKLIVGIQTVFFKIVKGPDDRLMIIAMVAMLIVQHLAVEKLCGSVFS
jgi:hypothetical protein